MVVDCCQEPAGLYFLGRTSEVDEKNLFSALTRNTTGRKEVKLEAESQYLERIAAEVRF